MVVKRKQLYLTEAQDRALKERAAALGISEAELVRRAVDAAVAQPHGPHGEMGDLLDAAEKIAHGHRLPRGWQLDRDELHERT